jgi:hypothetical protein
MAAGGRGEMAYAAGLGPVGGDTVGVQIPPPALYPLDKTVARDGVIGDPSTVSYAMWTSTAPISTWSTDIYMVSSQLFNVTTPASAAASSLTLKLISRIRALCQHPVFRAHPDFPE